MPKVQLSQTLIVDGATELADRHGLEAVTMRALADHLGTRPMSLYHYIPHKDALVDAMVDAVFSEIDLPVPGRPWRAETRRRALSARDALRRHPWAVGLLDSRATPGVDTLRHHDACLGTFRLGGFALADTAHAISVVDSYVYGFALQERAVPFESTDTAETHELADSIMTALDPTTLPHLVELTADHVMTADYRFADEFELGLDLVLDGIEARYAPSD